MDEEAMRERRVSLCVAYALERRRELFESAYLTKTDVESVVREAFRCPREDGGGDEELFGVIRLLSAQSELRKRTTSRTTRGVRCDVSTEYVGLRQNPSDGTNVHVFAYNVRLANTGESEVVSLDGRHWIIEDGAEYRSVVPKGSPGVVGLNPVLPPGAIFEYGSGLHLPSAVGIMSGSFQFRTSSGEPFDVVVNPTRFLGPSG